MNSYDRHQLTACELQSEAAPSGLAQFFGLIFFVAALWAVILFCFSL
jgi:hypothetical protein